MLPIIIALVLCTLVLVWAIKFTPSNKGVQLGLFLSPIGLGFLQETIGLGGVTTSWGPGVGTLILFGLFGIFILAILVSMLIQTKLLGLLK